MNAEMNVKGTVGMNMEMNREALYHGITAVDPILVEDAGKVRQPAWVRWWRYSAAAVACVLVLTLGSYQMLINPVATIYMTINPHVSMELNRMGNVTELKALNGDGFTLLQGYDYRHKSRLTVTQELIERARTMGFLTDQGKVTIAIEADDVSLSGKYENEFVNYLTTEKETVAVQELLPRDQIRTIALNHFGLNQAVFESIECDVEHDRTIYEVELRAGGIEYECSIDALTGYVYDVESERDDDRLPNGQTAIQDDDWDDVIDDMDDEDWDDDRDDRWDDDRDDRLEQQRPATTKPTATSTVATKPTTTTTTATVNITESQAKATALKQAGLATATFEKVELDTDDGRKIYKLEFWANQWEYECEIDAATGAILEWETDQDDDHGNRH